MKKTTLILMMLLYVIVVSCKRDPKIKPLAPCKVYTILPNYYIDAAITYNKCDNTVVIDTIYKIGIKVKSDTFTSMTIPQDSVLILDTVTSLGQFRRVKIQVKEVH